MTRDPAPPRRLPAAVSSDGREPCRLHGSRPRADAVARPARLSRGVDWRTPFRRLGNDQLARAVHRSGRGTDALDPLRHRRDFAAVSQPADDGEPHHPARSPHARSRHVRRRPWPARVRCADAGHRSQHAARSHGRGAGRYSSVLPRRDRHREDGLVHLRQRARASATLHAGRIRRSRWSARSRLPAAGSRASTISA